MEEFVRLNLVLTELNASDGTRLQVSFGNEAALINLSQVVQEGR